MIRKGTIRGEARQFFKKLSADNSLPLEFQKIKFGRKLEDMIHRESSLPLEDYGLGKFEKAKLNGRSMSHQKLEDEQEFEASVTTSQESIKVEEVPRKDYIVRLRLHLLKYQYRRGEMEEEKLDEGEKEEIDQFNMLYGLRMAKNLKKFNQFKA